MFRAPLLAAALGLASLVATQQSADAQLLFNQGTYHPNATTAALNWLYSRDTISPYVNLARRDWRAGYRMTYQRYVRPRLEAKQRQQMQQAFTRRTQNQQAVNALKSQVAVSSPGSPSSSSSYYGPYSSTRSRQAGPSPTGHITQSMSYLHYYPRMQQSRRR